MEDLTGKKFGNLLVIERAGSDRNKNALWKCKCDCGNEKIVVANRLRSGETRSCGCLRSIRTKETFKTHGHSKTRLYRVWAGMKTRCYNANSDNYKYYGGKGVTMCDEWKNNFSAFERWAIENGYNEDARSQECTIDRIDTSGDYSPQNCRWSNHVEQCNNQTSNKLLTYQNTTKTMSEWSKETGINYSTFRENVRRGRPVEEIIKSYAKNQI